MPSKLLASLTCIGVLSACSWNSPTTRPPQQTQNLLPSRQESVSFLSLIHKRIRESERASYDLMYGIRDGVDSFIYDVQKDAYQDYQK
jgi:hypothetical protein